MKQAVIGLAAIGLAGCATYGADAAPGQATAPPATEAMMCNAESAQAHIGHIATEAGGAAILKESGARTLRWGPPRSAWTMDYRQDRVNVQYDDQMKIIAITCG
ncbi:MAG: hypothetical protein CVT75_03715 [Alphaproteobacteria bacterium HGW-Alphaproteobacteria-14]|nr:MAG: hypothetical protein CVT75_03715 [Alphaproteobacteria bacterium HGW-Alphaproteobacteria-14]